MLNLIHGDCLEVMKTIPDASIDAIITDPPYGTTACKWDSVIPFEPMWEQLKRIIKPNGAIVLFGSEPFSSALRMSNIKQYKYDWIWDKVKTGNPLNAKKCPLPKTENISIFYSNPPIYNPQMSLREKVKKSGNVNKDNIKCFKGLDGKNREYTHKYPTNVLVFSNANQIGKVHPTQKPVALLEYLVKTYTQENQTVLDFTMGSGTTGIACKNLNRNFIGIEKDDNYFKIASDRINNNVVEQI
jgi:site-specific DNA-methyltransferase (adenine-specific)